MLCHLLRRAKMCQFGRKYGRILTGFGSDGPAYPGKCYICLRLAIYKPDGLHFKNTGNDVQGIDRS